MNRNTSAVHTIEGSTNTLNWLLADHHGSTSTTANEDGSWNSTIKYTAFGETRDSSGVTPTKYRYTGQLLEAEVGLYYYVARWYDPVTMHFTQADLVVPNVINAKAWDKYSYTLNNPILFCDPTGFSPCIDGVFCVPTTSRPSKTVYESLSRPGYYLSKEYYQKVIYRDFSMVLVDSNEWNTNQAQVIYRSLYEMKEGLNAKTEGRGREWIDKNLKDTRIEIGGIGLKDRCFVLGSTIHLAKDFDTALWRSIDYRVETLIIHEVGHVWDNRSSGKVLGGSLFGGGFGDALMNVVGGSSTGILGLRWINESLSIPTYENKFKNGNNYEYGNNSPADYFAHTFAAAIASPNNPNTPKLAEMYMNILIDLTR